jgi:hypothetical protein
MPGGTILIPLEEWLGHGFDTHSVLGTMPIFADAAAKDFHLLPGSVGIDMGEDLSGDVPVDIEGTQRPQGAAFDCGCYETEHGKTPAE